MTAGKKLGPGGDSTRRTRETSDPVGLVHDYLLVLRGAERAFAAIADIWPSAPIYTTLYSAAGTGQRFAGRRIETSYLQHLHVGQRGFRWLLPFYPRAVEELPVDEHELIVSSSSAFAHGVRPSPGAAHVCYCHTPFRYAWHEHELALRETPRVVRPLIARELDRIRRWDLAASSRVTAYIAISDFVRQRIADLYGREAEVVHPPVEVERFSPLESEDFFLVVAELVRHKRVHVALEAANRAGKRVKVVGEGPELDRLKSMFSSSAEFLGRLPDRDLSDLYSRARALILPGVEEFGITAVEAQAAGRPVVARDAGGVRETVIDGVTGVLVAGGEADDFAEVLGQVDFDAFSPKEISEHAAQFSTEAFKHRFSAAVSASLVSQGITLGHWWRGGSGVSL